LRCAGTDVGGTKLLTVVLEDGVVVESWKEPTPTAPQELIARLAAITGDVRADAMGVGIAGAVTRDGTVRYSPNLPAVRELAVGPLVAEATGVPVVVDNDATCALRGEHAMGAARAVRDAVLVTVGTGLGGGLLLDGHIVRGAHGFGGEVGHMVVAEGGEPCPCGRRGCWERYASGTALGARPDDGDFERLGWWLALGLVNLDQLLDVERFVLAGGVSEAGDRLLGPVISAWDQHAVGGSHRDRPDIVLAELGERSGAIGAALLALDPQA
jgi:glucokinase